MCMPALVGRIKIAIVRLSSENASAKCGRSFKGQNGHILFKKKDVKLSIRKTVNVVTVMFAVMKEIQSNQCCTCDDCQNVSNHI